MRNRTRDALQKRCAEQGHIYGRTYYNYGQPYTVKCQYCLADVQIQKDGVLIWEGGN